MTSILNAMNGEKEPWIASFIIRVGIPMSAFVGITIWALWRVDSNIIAQGNNISHHLSDTSYLIKQNEEIKNLLQRQINLSQQICVNTARSGRTRDCFQ